MSTKEFKKIKQNTAKNTRGNVDKIKTLKSTSGVGNLHTKEEEGLTDIQLKPKNVMKTV